MQPGRLSSSHKAEREESVEDHIDAYPKLTMSEVEDSVAHTSTTTMAVGTR
jgi:hypothetical protein